jgi:flavin reductase (DIM6/NTAB) family NADH-FMN oxidoreductase RutF
VEKPPLVEDPYAEPPVTAEPPVASRDLRSVLGMYATGVTVITTAGTGEPYGMTANSFTAVSLEPPLVLVCAASGGKGAALISASGHFAVNVLSARQQNIARLFASRHRPRGRDAFAGVPHHRLLTGAPVINGAAAYLDCALAAEHEAGDHVIFIGEVLALGPRLPASDPLVFFAGRYTTLLG